MTEPRYRIIGEPIGSGGSATVYRAFDTEAQKEVALKVIEGDLKDAALVQRFFRQVTVVESLAGVPGVARIRDHGWLRDGPLAGRPYIAFELYPGTLWDALDKYAGRPQASAALVLAVARTVAEAHARGVFHGDLKPPNVLLDPLDGHGQPFLTDFGAARRLGQSRRSTVTGEVLATITNMAPELARDPTRPPTEGADVYGLGTILYELLVGHAPYEGTDPEVYRKLVSNEPVPSPRSRGVALPRPLELVCLCCLEKRPQLRYTSAQLVVEELAAFVDRRPTWIETLPYLARFRRLCARFPLVSVVASVVVVVTLTAGALSAWTATALEEELLRRTAQENMYAAEMAAGQVLHLHRSFGDALRPCAKRPALLDALLDTRAALRDPKSDTERRVVANALSECAPPATFDSIVLLGLDGCPLARTPELPPDYFTKCFAFRNYLWGAELLAERRALWALDPPQRRGVEPEDFFIARAHTSEGDHQFKFSVAMPVFDGTPEERAARPVGYLMATLGTAPTIASFPLSDPNDPGRVGSIVSLRDRERDEADNPLPDEFRVVIHPDLEHGKTKASASPALDELLHAMKAEDPRERHQFQQPSGRAMTFSANHEDPVTETKERLIAGFARVGQTEQVVIVQTRYEAILSIVRDYLWRVMKCAGLLLALGVGVVLVAVTRMRRKAWI